MSRLPVALLVCVGLMGSGWTSSAQSIAPANQTAVFEGRIVEVFGNRFILEIPSGRFLVEPSDAPGVSAAKPGDQVKVEGTLSYSTIQTRRITRDNGESLFEAAPGPAVAGSSAAAMQPSSPGAQQVGMSSTLARLGLTALGDPVRKKRHTELLARMNDGRIVYVSFDPGGRLWEIEDANHEKEVVPSLRSLNDDDLRKIVREAGFAPVGSVEIKKHHFAIEVLSGDRERLELHIDRTGYIYKQIWLW